jgi:hypothetical protein
VSKTAARERRAVRVRDKRASRAADAFVSRPFEGLGSETEWVAMREVVPAATATVRLTAAAGERLTGTELTLATVLPLTWPGLCTPDGRWMIGVHAPARSGDLSRDLAQALELALTAPPNHRVVVSGLPGPGNRLQDLVEPAPLVVQIHSSFDYWLGTVEPVDAEVSEAMKRANSVTEATVRLAAAPSAYWCRSGGKPQLRWVLPWAEDTALAALSRVYAADQLSLGDGSRFVGTYRAHGLLIPVWDLPEEQTADRWETALAATHEALIAAEATTEPMSAAERRVRDGLRLRQMTLR